MNGCLKVPQDISIALEILLHSQSCIYVGKERKKEKVGRRSPESCLYIILIFRVSSWFQSPNKEELINTFIESMGTEEKRAVYIHSGQVIFFF
jgi:hypothetical protein